MKRIKLPNKLYDTMKYICLIAVPAIIWFLVTLGDIWGFDPEKVTQTISATATFVGLLIGLSSINYSKGRVEDAYNQDLLQEQLGYEELMAKMDEDGEEED